MNAVLKCFDVVLSGKIIAHFELFKNGYINQVRTKDSIIYSGIYAENKYYETLQTNKILAEKLGATIIEKR